MSTYQRRARQARSQNDYKAGARDIALSGQRNATVQKLKDEVIRNRASKPKKK